MLARSVLERDRSTARMVYSDMIPQTIVNTIGHLVEQGAV